MLFVLNGWYRITIFLVYKFVYIEISSRCFRMFSHHIWCICFTHDVSASHDSENVNNVFDQKQSVWKKTIMLQTIHTDINWWEIIQKHQNKLIIIELSCAMDANIIIWHTLKTIWTAVHFYFNGIYIRIYIQCHIYLLWHTLVDLFSNLCGIIQ